MSTLEATARALVMLEGPSFDAAPLLDAFGRFVAGVAAQQGPQAERSPALQWHAGEGDHEQAVHR